MEQTASGGATRRILEAMRCWLSLFQRWLRVECSHYRPRPSVAANSEMSLQDKAYHGDVVKMPLSAGAQSYVTLVLLSNGRESYLYDTATEQMQPLDEAWHRPHPGSISLGQHV